MFNSDCFLNVMYVIDVIINYIKGIEIYDMYLKYGYDDITVDKELVELTGIANFLYWDGLKVIGQLKITNIKSNLQFQEAQMIAKQKEFGIRAAYILS